MPPRLGLKRTQGTARSVEVHGSPKDSSKSANEIVTSFPLDLNLWLKEVTNPKTLARFLVPVLRVASLV